METVSDQTVNTGQRADVGAVSVVVLAAGLGQRLAGVSGGRPKWLLDVNGRTIADRQLDGFAQLGSLISSVTAVTGAEAAQIEAVARARGVHTLHNPLHAQYNNWYSALLALEARPFGDDELLVLANADLCGESTLFSAFMQDAVESSAGAVIAADFARELTDEAMKMSRADGAGDLLGAIGKVEVSAPVAEYPGLLALRGRRIPDYARTLRAFEADPACHNNWYEHGIQAELAAGRPWTMIGVRTPAWVEIDTPDDLAGATALLASS